MAGSIPSGKRTIVSHKFEPADMRGCKFFEGQSVATTIRSQPVMVQRSAMKAFWS